MEELVKAILESLCGTVGRLVLKLFGVQKGEGHWLSWIVGLVIILALIFAVVLVAIQVSAGSKQRRLAFNLTFGVYLNDHAKRKFTSRERKWELTGHRLKYSIDAGENRYGDTAILDDKEISRVIQMIQKRGLARSVSKSLKTSYKKRYGYDEVIRGRIDFKGKAADILIRAEGYGLLEQDNHGKGYLELEKVLFEIIESRRNG